MANENEDTILVNERVNMHLPDDDDDDDCDTAIATDSPTKKKPKTPIEKLELRKNELLKKVVEINLLLKTMKDNPAMMPALMAARRHYF